MLSERLATVAEWFEQYRESGLEMEPIGVVMTAGLLRDMADDAAILEQNTRPINPMGGTGPTPIPEDGNVVAGPGR